MHPSTWIHLLINVNIPKSNHRDLTFRKNTTSKLKLLCTIYKKNIICRLSLLKDNLANWKLNSKPLRPFILLPRRRPKFLKDNSKALHFSQALVLPLLMVTRLFALFLVVVCQIGKLKPISIFYTFRDKSCNEVMLGLMCELKASKYHVKWS